MGRIKTAVVGLRMGLGHAQAYHRSERSELAYVVDLDEELAAKVAGDLGCQYATDWTTILDKVDAVSLCTPHHLHAPQALQAIAAGKHVLVEKPLANSEEECLQVIRAAEEKDVRLMVAYVVRYLPAIRKLKEIIDSGRYGQPIHAQGYVLGYLEPRPDTWFARKEMLGGGVLFSHGCHYIDILVWLFGDPKRVVSLGTRNGTEWLEGEGTAHSTIEFENGVLAHLVSSWGTKFALPPAKYQIHTTDALIVLSNDMQEIEVLTKEGREVVFTKPADALPSVSYEVEHFLESIATGQAPETDGHDALRSHRTIWAMYASEGVPVSL